jgi:hypothetical protein
MSHMPTTSPLFVASSGRGGLLDCKAAGVVADGVTDSGPLLAELVQFAIDNDYTGLRLPEGITQIHGTDATGRLGIDLRGITDFVIAGSGPGSILRMSKEFAQDRRLIYIATESERIVIRDLTLDGNWDGETGNEQVHGIQVGTGEVGGLASDVTVQNCWFRDIKGDAVRLLGADSGGEVSNVTIDGCRFTDADRCGIAVQRGTYDVHITNNHFAGGSDQQLDMEASGASSVGRYVITGNTFDGTNDTPTRLLVTLGGSSDSNPNTSTIFANNVVRGRMQMTNVVGLRFTGNQIVPGAELTIEPTVNFIRICKGAVVSGNHFERPTGSTAGPVVQFTQLTGLVPDGILFAGNTVDQYTAYTCVSFDGCDNVVASGNIIRFLSANTATYAAIVLDATTASLESFTASGNTIIGNVGGGTLGYGVQVNARTFVIGRAVVSGNSIKSAATGVIFEKSSGSYTNFPVCTGNSITSATAAVSHASQTIVVGGQQGSIVDLVGAGSPESAVTALIGSTFRRTDGSTGTSHYVKESGSSNTGWVSTGAVTVANDSITNAKLANVATATIKGRTTGGTGDPEDLTVAQAKALLDIDDLEAADIALDGRLDTAEGDISALETADSALDTRLDAIEANNWVTTARIADDAVTNAELANMAAATIKGSTAGGSPEDLTATQATALLNVVSTSAKGLVPQAGNTTYKVLRDDATFAAVSKSFQFGGSTIATGTAATAFGVPGGDNSAPSTVQVPVTFPWDVSIVSVRFTVRGTSGSSGTVVIRLRANGSDSGVTISAPVNISNGTTTSTTGCPYAVPAGTGLCANIETTSLAGSYQGWAVVYEYVRTS